MCPHSTLLATQNFNNDDVEFNVGRESFEEDIFEEDRIVGGQATTIQRHPYQVSLRRGSNHICGGSVLTVTRVLTAAFCVQQNVPPSQFTIMAGSTMRRGDANAQYRTVSRFIIHPRYFPRILINNVAVVHFVRPLIFDSTVRPITLPRQNAPMPYRRNSTVTGWGLTNENGTTMPNRLRVVRVPIITNFECSLAYPLRIFVDMVCAGVPGGGIDACRGDDGGPLVVGGVQFGIASRGRDCGRPRSPGIYVRVPHFADWIRSSF